MTFAEKVKEARKQLGLSQEKFAGKMGVSFSTINRWEKGRFLPSYLAQAQFDSFCKDNGIVFNDTGERMTYSSIAELRNRSPYSGTGSLTREQFLFFEMRTTAKLMIEGLSDEEIYERIYGDNLFQFPTEKSIKSITSGCVRRLKSLNNNELVYALATLPTDEAKQICLYAIIRQSPLVRDFMVKVIGEKYRLKDMSFGKKEANVFLMRLQEQDDYVATWSGSTIGKIRQVLIKILVENEYLDNINSDHLNPVLISRVLENGIRANNDESVFPAFNYFE